MLDTNPHTIKSAKILIVDDEPVNIRLLSDLCKSLGYEIIAANNGTEAMECAVKEHPDLVLMDIMMPVMDGFEATKNLKSNELTKSIPVIILTALNQKKDLLKGISLGASDFISKPFNIQELTLRIKNNLTLKEYHDFLKNHNVILENEVAKKSLELMKAYEELNETHRQTKESYIETIQKLNLAAEYKDEETGAHIKRISLYSEVLADAMDLSSEFIEHIYYASPMHDIGKVGIPDGILLKENELSPEEWALMKSHTTIGAKILSGSESTYLKMAEEIAFTHHESWNGKGYPRGLKGKKIPLSGRIVNIADQYDALRSKRPYKIALDHDMVVKILTEGDGRTTPKNFDPDVLIAFKKSASKLQKIYNENSDDNTPET